MPDTLSYYGMIAFTGQVAIFIQKAKCPNPPIDVVLKMRYNRENDLRFLYEESCGYFFGGDHRQVVVGLLQTGGFAEHS